MKTKSLPFPKQLRHGMTFDLSIRLQRRICDAKTGKPVFVSPWSKNLVLDFGLNSMAKKTPETPATTANSFEYCRLGSGTEADKIHNPAVTFDQSTTTVTASASFFTSDMVSGILKYDSGSAGVEQYIVAVADATHATVDTSRTESAKDGTFWRVQRTALQTAILGGTGVSNSYQIGAGDCGTSFTTTQATHKRTFVFAEPGAAYTVNEIAWSRIATGSIYGRILLATGDTIGPGYFYVVALELTLTMSPATPTAVPNVGTNIDTAGTAMFENWAGLSTVSSSSGASVAGPWTDGTSGSAMAVVMPTATYSQNATIASGNSGPTPASVTLTTTLTTWVNDAAQRGQMTNTNSPTLTTSGQTTYGVGIKNSTVLGFDVKFTTTFVLPTGTFKPTVVFRVTYNRTLNN